MSSLNVKKWLKLLGAVFVLSELTAVITGPPGNPTHPWEGFHGSIVDQASFLGLFTTQRWAAFFVYGLIVSGAAYVFRTQKQFITRVGGARRNVDVRKVFLFLLLVVHCSAFDLTLWYPQPAAKGMSEALPVGNGCIGAMVHGGVPTEHIQFNEHTIWTGQPHSYAHLGATNVLRDIRRLLQEMRNPVPYQ